MAQQWTEGRVSRKRGWNEHLFSLQISADIEPFQPGQFTRLGLEIDGEVVGRPYSLVNPPGEQPLEFLFGVVRGGPLSPRLAALEEDARVLVAPRANGFLVLSEVPDRRHLWLVASGTGIGPFLSMLRTAEPWQRFEKVVLVHAVRHRHDLSFGDLIEEAAARHGSRFAFVPFVSREPTDFALPGRIPEAIADGRLEARARVTISPEQSQFMLCGNPAMVDDVTAALIARDLKKHRRKDPGHISVESYW
jgi:ferredoxin--NADP+ reductase